MSAGQPIVGDVETFPPAEQQEYRAQGIASLAYYPITVEGEWWGCIGFEDCDGPRAWVLSDLDGVRTAAAMLGAAISRQRQEERLRDAETRYRSVVEQIPAVTYVDVSRPEGVRLAFLSPQIEALLGYPANTFLDDPDAWFELVHPDDLARVDAAARRAGNAGDRLRRGIPDAPRRRALGLGTRHVEAGAGPQRRGTRPTSKGSSSTSPHARRPRRHAREAEHRYRTMVEALPAVTYIDEPIEGEDLNATMPFVSPQIEAMLGLPGRAVPAGRQVLVQRDAPRGLRTAA